MATLAARTCAVPAREAHRAPTGSKKNACKSIAPHHCYHRSARILHQSPSAGPRAAGRGMQAGAVPDGAVEAAGDLAVGLGPLIAADASVGVQEAVVGALALAGVLGTLYLGTKGGPEPCEACDTQGGVRCLFCEGTGRNETQTPEVDPVSLRKIISPGGKRSPYECGACLGSGLLLCKKCKGAGMINM